MAEAGKYRLRPVEVDVLRYTGDNLSAVKAFIGGDYGSITLGSETEAVFFGSRFAARGDYLVKDADGVVQAYSPDRFAELYEPQQDQPEVAIEQGLPCEMCEERKPDVESVPTGDGDTTELCLRCRLIAREGELDELRALLSAPTRKPFEDEGFAPDTTMDDLHRPARYRQQSSTGKEDCER